MVCYSQPYFMTEQAVEVYELLRWIICSPLTQFSLHFANIHRSSPVTWLPLHEKFQKAQGPLPLGYSFTPLTHRVDGFPVL